MNETRTSPSISRLRVLSLFFFCYKKVRPFPVVLPCELPEIWSLVELSRTPPPPDCPTENRRCLALFGLVGHVLKEWAVGNGTPALFLLVDLLCRSLTMVGIESEDSNSPRPPSYTMAPEVPYANRHPDYYFDRGNLIIQVRRGCW
jgi:hypothetical protein